MIDPRCLERGAGLTQRGRRVLHVEAVKVDLIRGRTVAVVLAHPLDEVEHLLGVPGPVHEAFEHLPRVADALGHVAVDRKGLAEAGLEREYAKSVLLDQLLKQAHAKRGKFVGAVAGLADRDDLGLSQALHERGDVRPLESGTVPWSSTPP